MIEMNEREKVIEKTTIMNTRNSSLELLRIIAMLIIIAYHFGYHGLFNMLHPPYCQPLMGGYLLASSSQSNDMLGWGFRQFYLHAVNWLFHGKTTGELAKNLSTCFDNDSLFVGKYDHSVFRQFCHV